MAEIFISYARPDLAIAKSIADAFVEAGFTVFFDQGIRTGDNWDVRIENELSLASAVVVLWSKASRDRPWVKNEARAGLRRSILFPATLDDCNVPVEFTHIQSASLQAYKPGLPDAGWLKLKSDVVAALREKRTPEASAPNQGAIMQQDIQDALEDALNNAQSRHALHNTVKLHHEVRRAVSAARSAEISAIMARHHAVLAASRGEERANMARNAAPGTAVQRLHDGDLYEGEVSGRFPLVVINGFGVRTMSGLEEYRGDRYAGRFISGRLSGSGVYTYGRNSNNRSKSLRYEGDFAQDFKSGFGFFSWRSGEYCLGSFADDVVHGPGVHFFTDGRCHEGYSAEWFADGYGVEWLPDGSHRAGIWSRNRLITPLTA